jgi:molybdopterin/thiamine biosynthesis adenylyltransferase
MKSFYELFTERNIGIVSQEEQDRIRKSRIGIAGVGGVGGLLAERLVRLGVMNIRITDPGVFDESNLNRQFGCTSKSIGKNKARTVARLLKEINPELSVGYDLKGITDESSADSFLRTCDLVVDEMDYGLFYQSGFLQTAAQQQNKVYIFSSAVGFGAYTCVFHPQGLTLEEYNRTRANMETIHDQPIVEIETVLPYIPEYVKSKMDMVKQMLQGERAVSTNSIGVGLASILTAHLVAQVILSPSSVSRDKPLVYIIDLQDGHLDRTILSNPVARR